MFVRVKYDPRHNNLRGKWKPTRGRMAPLMESIERQRAMEPHSLINVSHNNPKDGQDTLQVETGVRGTSNAKL